MASMTLRGLKTTGRLKPIFSLRSLSTTRVVNGSKPWYYLYEPDSYPESEKEVEVAAKKYGMVPFDYKPFPRDLSEENFGDYPDIPIIFKSQRLHENYDMPALKRNYGEPVHINEEMYTGDRYDPKPEYSKFPKWQYWGFFLSVVTTWGLLQYFLPQFIDIAPTPMMPKQYPFEQVAVNYPEKNYPKGRHGYKCVDRSKHYTFEKAS